MELELTYQQEIQKEFEREDLEVLIAKLESFAHRLTKNSGLGEEPFDIVSDVLLSVQRCDGGRNWDKSTCPSFDKFLFNCVRGHIWNLYKKHYNRLKAEDEFSADSVIRSQEERIAEQIDFDQIKTESLQALASLNPTIEEECIFECWLDGVSKPKDIANLLEITSDEVYNATKRLNRKLPQLREQLKDYFL